ncbi:50S ribosomal protein L17 [uncultured Odoribacter sp.]|uniref:50S ribosomal protein L17 n=1 Tax=uncultured Odoribacter sp. TaxID=876416 RepID=UPI00262ECCDE|nr:50S ribosomal protein L17 [uncultured Odoribacter sp.]
MRHCKKFNHLNRKSAHRKALLSNMATSLILHKRIYTTVAKAKALKIYVEPLITKSKNDNMHSRRVVFSYLGQKEAVTELFREVAPKIVNRPGGYTRILRTGNRIGDNAETCMMELVDFNATYTEVKQEVKKTATRRRRSSAKKATAEVSDAVVEEAPKAVAPEAEASKAEEAPKAE